MDGNFREPKHKILDLPDRIILSKIDPWIERDVLLLFIPKWLSPPYLIFNYHNRTHLEPPKKSPQ